MPSILPSVAARHHAPRSKEVEADAPRRSASASSSDPVPAKSSDHASDHASDRAARSAPSSDAHDGAGAVTYRVTADDVYLRTHSMGLVTGVLHKGDEFIATQQHKGFLYGYAAGHADKPGWILFGPSEGQGHTAKRVDERSVPDSIKGDDPNPRTAEGINYVRGRDRMPNPWDLSFPTTVKDGGVKLYENYTEGQGPADTAFELPAGAEIGLRYMVNDDWAMFQVKSTTSPDGKPRWLFGRLSDVQVRDSATAFNFLKNGVPLPDGYKHPKA